MAKIITALKVQKKNPQRINVYLDGNFAFGVSRIVSAWLSVGQELPDEKIAILQQQENQEVALQRAMLLLSYRPRSEAEIRQKLLAADFSEDVIMAVIERLRQNSLVHDEGFARSWVENRSAFRPRSRKLLAYELRRKGVAAEAIDSALEEAGEDSSLAYMAAIRYARKLESLEWETFHRRLLSFLARRGFSYETSAPIVRQVWEEIQPGTENAELIENEDQ